MIATAMIQDDLNCETPQKPADASRNQNFLKLTLEEAEATPTESLFRASTIATTIPRKRNVHEWGDLSTAAGATTRSCSTVMSDKTIARNRELVEAYDSRRAVTLRAYEDFKCDKWGEDRFADFEINDEDLHLRGFSDLLSLSLADSRLAQCVSSYATVLATFISRTEAGWSSAKEDLKEPGRDAASCNYVGDLAVPKAVQEVLDVALAVKDSASKVFSALMGRECPRRAVPSPCPRRRMPQTVGASNHHHYSSHHRDGTT